MTTIVPERTTRTKDGTLAIPIAVIAEVMDAPNTVAKISAMSSAGNASQMSVIRIRNSLHAGRTMPARMPSGVPITAAMPTATMPT